MALQPATLSGLGNRSVFPSFNATMQEATDCIQPTRFRHFPQCNSSACVCFSASTFSLLQEDPLLCLFSGPTDGEGEPDQVQQGSGQCGPGLQQENRSVQGTGQGHLPVLLLHSERTEGQEDRPVAGGQQLLGGRVSHSPLPSVHREQLVHLHDLPSPGRHRLRHPELWCVVGQRRLHHHHVWWFTACTNEIKRHVK